MVDETDLGDWGFFVVIDEEVLSQTSKQNNYYWLDEFETSCWEILFQTVLWPRIHVSHEYRVD